MIILNLFIGVIGLGMAEAQLELAEEQRRQQEARAAKLAAGMSLAGTPGTAGAPALAVATLPAAGPRAAAPRRRTQRRVRGAFGRVWRRRTAAPRKPQPGE